MSIEGRLRLRLLLGAPLVALTLAVAAPPAESQSYLFTHLAGSTGGPGWRDGMGSEARFYHPRGVAVDGSGNVYVGDSSNCTIRRITPAGVVTTLAGQAGSAGSADGMGSAASFYQPDGVAVDGAGNVYVADTSNHTIRKVTPAGVVTTLAGQAGSVGSADGTGSAARFSGPSGVAVDGAGNVYVADTYNHTIRKVTPAGVVTTLAGQAGSVGSADGTGSAASFYWPDGVAVDESGNLYVADYGNDTIRRVTPAGVVTTMAGQAGLSGSADGTGSAAQFSLPEGVAVDGSGNVYVADSGSHTIRKVTPAGVVTTLAGEPGSWGGADGTGSAARFDHPAGVAVDGSGNVYVADLGNHTIRKITPVGVVTTLAGQARGGSADGTWIAARFFDPFGVAVDGSGNVYVADSGNHTIRKVTPAGVVTTLAGEPGLLGSADGTGSAARFDHPGGVAVDGFGNVYVADTYNETIRRVTPAGVVTTRAGQAGSWGSADGTGSAARFSFPTSVAVDGAGNVYVADTGNSTIRRMTPAGVVTTLAGKAGSWGSADGTGSAAQFNGPRGVAVDGSGNVYVADYGGNKIRKIRPGGIVKTLAGSGAEGSADGTGSAALFYYPAGVAVDGAGSVYVADRGNDTIRKVAADGVVTTLAGQAGSWGSTDGTGSAARFKYPVGIAVDGSGNVYVADSGNDAIRKGFPATEACVQDALTACLIGGRYRVTSHWQNQYAGGQADTLSAAPLTDTTAAFWLFGAERYEYLIRINTATDNGRAWISIPTFTDVEFWVAVTDTVSGQYYEYHSPAGNRALIYDPYFFVYP
jgi:sugar lactone lactonase YvrE